MTIVEKSVGSFKSFDGTSIYYEVRGQGEPIVLVYGIACLINHWHFQIEHLSQSYKVITFDLRAHHKSGVPEDKSQMTIEAIAKDLPFLLRELGLQKAHFVGHSFGAPVLLRAYSQAPEIFKSLTFINGFAKNPIKGMFGLDVIEPLFFFVKSQYDKNPALWDQIWKLAADNPLAAWGTGLLGGFNLKLTQLKDIQIYLHGVGQMALSSFLPFFEEMMSFSGESIAASIQVPTLIISGEKDMVTPQKFQDELHELIKGSQFVRIPYGSHCTQLDFPDYVNLKLDTFFNSLKS
jgi:pimeloyl-ACP methyl ester carboxylesterase